MALRTVPIRQVKPPWSLMIHILQFLAIAPNLMRQSERELMTYFQNTSILTVTFLPPHKKIKWQQFFAQPGQNQQLNFAIDNFRGWGNWVELRAHTQWYMTVHADVISVGMVKVPKVKVLFKKGYLIHALTNIVSSISKVL